MVTEKDYDAIVIGASTAAVSRLCPTLARAGWLCQLSGDFPSYASCVASALTVK